MNLKPYLKYFGCLLFVSTTVSAVAQEAYMQPFKLSQVRLLQSPFLQAENVTLQYMLKLEPDRLLAPFLREAGLKPKAESYGNWENTGLDGHTGGHYLTALAQMYAATGNPECKRRLDYMVSELARCQANGTDGYVGGVPGSNQMWAKFKQGDFSEFNKKWVPWYNLHKLYAGLRDSYLLAGNQQAKDVFLKLTDWAMNELSGLSEEQVQRMLGTEHGGMNEVCADAAVISGQKKYMELARKFSHQSLLLPLEKQQDKLSGLHANTQIPKVIGFERIGELSNDTVYRSAARFFWKTVVNKRSISIGGNSVREHFNPADNFATMLESDQGPETCNSNNMLKLSKMLFLQDFQAQYIEFYERLLYNHILSSQHPQRGGYVYFTPIHPQHYRVYSTADESFWCCVGTGMENHGKYGELIYTHKNKDLYVNLFIPSVLNWRERNLKVTQQGEFPENESTQLKVQIAKPERFTIFMRKPKWLKEQGYSIKVNGKAVNSSSAGEYVTINRVWKTGDLVRVQLPMKSYTEYLPDNSQWVSFLRGPLVLAAPTDTTNLVGLNANGSRWGHIATGPMYALNTSPLLTGTSSQINSAITKSASDNNIYTVGEAVVQDKFKNLKLVPFYKLHDTRYMLYWPVVSSKDSVKQKEAELQMLDNTYIKLASRTIDGVSPGEQQPENDHGMVTDQSETGIFRNLHWRNAAGFFSYRLRMSAAVNKLSITYYGLEKGAEFDIYLNETKLEHISLNGTEGDAFVTKEFTVPEDIKKAGNSVLVKFVASPGKKTAAIYNLRLLR
jgi:DUF1680 family protein